MFHWVHSSIRNKMLLSVVGMGVLITVVMGAISYSVSSDALRRRIDISLVNLAEARANEMDIYLSSVARIPLVFAGAIEADPVDDEALLRQRMRNVLLDNPDIYGTAVAYEPYTFDPELEYFSPYWWYDEGEATYLQFGSDDYVYWEWDWYAAPRDSGRQVWSPPFYDKGAGETLMVTSSVPFERDGVFAGVVTVDVSLEKLSQILQDVAEREEFDERGHALLLGADGQIISIDDPALISDDLQAVIDTHINAVAGGRLRHVAEQIGGAERSVEQIDSPFGDGPSLFSVTAPIPSTGWHLVILAPADVLLADAVTLRTAYVVLVAAVTVLAALLAVRLADRLTQPVVHLTRTVEQVAAGNLEVSAAVASQDETGALGRTFNMMTSQLRTLIRNLKAEIDERKQIEQNLRRLNQAIEQSPVSVLITDTEGKIEYVNPKFVDITGYASDEVIGSTPSILQPEGNWALTSEEVWATISAGEEWSGEFRNRHKTGELRWELASIAGVKDRDGEITHYVYVAEDITRRKQMEQETLRQERLASVGKLAAGIAHDFNNLLMTMMANAELLRHQPGASHDLVARLGEIIRQGERGARLTRQVLDFSRESVAEFQAIDLKPYLNETLKFIGRTIPETISIEFGFGPRDYTVNGDAAQLQQVITNLALNARDAMPDGGTLRVQLSDANPRPVNGPAASGDDFVDWIRLEVSDTGCGIPAAALPHIFDPFFTTKEVGQGSGLGLAQIFGIVKNHGGRITVDSREGQGTTFMLYLPAMRATAKPVSERVDPLPKGHGEIVLLVEDDDSLRETAYSMLDLLDYEVVMASNGAEALELFDSRHDEIALVVTDAVMPVMGGFELAAVLRSKAPDVRVVMMSGYTGEGAVPPEAERDLVALLVKPVSIYQLATALSGCLAGERADDDARATVTAHTAPF